MDKFSCHLVNFIVPTTNQLSQMSNNAQVRKLCTCAPRVYNDARDDATYEFPIICHEEETPDKRPQLNNDVQLSTHNLNIFIFIKRKLKLFQLPGRFISKRAWPCTYTFYVVVVTIKTRSPTLIDKSGARNRLEKFTRAPASSSIGEFRFVTLLC